ncbi:MAG TPA: D-alanyl-D-alanine carboxypeptidase [Candidatus Tumulicola sp.]|jgi:PBP4 family serine-type D-alanyl-D-alanine carboxypeptidase
MRSPTYRAYSVIALAASMLATSLAFSAAADSAATEAPSSATAVPADIRAVFDQPIYKNSTWGLRVVDGKNVLVDWNPQRHFFIGSVRKVFTVGQLLNAVGPSHTYDTPVYRTGAVDRGVLHGNLIVVASGDLTMGGRVNPDGTIAVSNWDHNEADGLGNAILTKPDPLAGYAKLARAVKAAGITRVAGNVVIDDRLFKPFLFRGQFDVRPIFVNDDCVDVTILPGGKPGSTANVTSRPVSAALKIVNRLKNGPPGTSDTLSLKPVLPACIGESGCTSTLSGVLPSDYKPPLTGQAALVQTVRIVQPSNYARTVFVESLRRAGVAVDAPAVQVNPSGLLPAKNSYRAADQVAKLVGMPYGQDAKHILKISYNIGADTSLVLFGLTRHVDSLDASLAVERQNLRASYGIPSSDYHFVDGSGGGNTTATNDAVTRVLEELAHSPASSAFVAALPILGVDGSLAFVKDFESDSTLAGAAGNVRAKTGTYVGESASGGMELKGQAFGGYITTKSGRHLTYELVVNNLPIKKVLDITTVFQDEGKISAMLWRDY